MGRLIDADELKKYLKKYLHYGHAIPWVDAQPTAYDPDKVVEQLEKLKSLVPVNRVLDDIVNDKPKELGMLIAYNKAIEIVKSSEQEQKSECEWKLEDAESNLYVTGCENRQ